MKLAILLKVDKWKILQRGEEKEKGYHLQVTEVPPQEDYVYNVKYLDIPMY